MADPGWSAFRKTVLGVALVAAPLLLLVSNALTGTIYEDNQATYLANIADNEARFFAGNMIGAVGALFLAGAVLALIHLVRHRYPRYAKGAGGLALLGTLTMSGVWLVFSIIEYQMAQEANRAAMATFMNNADDSAAMAPLFVVWIASLLGMVLLSAALLRAGTLPRWMPALMIVGFVLVFPAEGALSVVADAVILAGMGSIGVAVLCSPLAAWESGSVAPREVRSVEPAEVRPVEPAQARPVDRVEPAGREMATR